MAAKLVEGVFSAVPTPRDERGNLSMQGLEGWLEFLLGQGIQGFAVNGATGEFPVTPPSELRDILAAVSRILDGRGKFVVGIGAGDARTACHLGEIAIDKGAMGLLLPTPGFFHYMQDDVISFVNAVADALSAPILLYNLPQFTTGIEPRTALELISKRENIVGIKDSSGSLESLRLLRDECPDACRIVGNDGALGPALHEGLADGVISGVACVLPELIQRIFKDGVNGVVSEKLMNALYQFIHQLDKMPTPWGLKVMGEARGLAKASFPFPLSEGRERERVEMAEWFSEYRNALVRI